MWSVILKNERPLCENQSRGCRGDTENPLRGSQGCPGEKQGSLDLGGGAELSQDLVVGGCCGVEVQDQEREELGSGCCCVLTGQEGWLGGIFWKVLLQAC